MIKLGALCGLGVLCGMVALCGLGVLCGRVDSGGGRNKDNQRALPLSRAMSCGTNNQCLKVIVKPALMSKVMWTMGGNEGV